MAKIERKAQTPPRLFGYDLSFQSAVGGNQTIPGGCLCDPLCFALVIYFSTWNLDISDTRICRDEAQTRNWSKKAVVLPGDFWNGNVYSWNSISRMRGSRTATYGELHAPGRKQLPVIQKAVLFQRWLLHRG